MNKKISRLEVIKDLITKYIGSVTPTGNHALDADREENLILLIDTVFYLEDLLYDVAGIKKTEELSHDVIVNRARTALQAIYDTLDETESITIYKRNKPNEDTYKFVFTWEDGTREEYLFKQVNKTWTSADAVLGKEDWIIKDCPTVHDVIDELISQDKFIDTIDVYQGPKFDYLYLYYIKDEMP